MQLQQYKNIYCIGIGGIGLSALARYFRAHGATVSGSDGGTSLVTESLTKIGVTVFLGHKASQIPEGVDLVVYTIAIKEDNKEFLEAKKRGVSLLTYPEALGILTESYTTIAVCGTHGKTTTTAMIASMLQACGKDPTVIVGSLVSDKDGNKTNFIAGTSEYCVVEACEYKRSFLNLKPTHVVVTNIDEDHLDYYKDIHDIQNAFQSFAEKIPSSGLLITHSDVFLETKGKHINADEVDRQSVSLSVLGDHNKSNAQLALSLAKALNLSEECARKGLFDFKGTWRRLEYKGVWNGIVMYDDYGHHPNEIKATLQAIREKYQQGEYRLIVIFQPHLFSRTKLLFNEFVQSFLSADLTYILPIYASREQNDGTISSQTLAQKTPCAIFGENYESIKKSIMELPYHKTVLITIGAGDVYHFHEFVENH